MMIDEELHLPRINTGAGDSPIIVIIELHKHSLMSGQIKFLQDVYCINQEKRRIKGR